MRLRVSDLSEVTGLIMAAAGEHNSPGLQPESLFRTHRAAGLLLSVPDVPRGVPASLHDFGAPKRRVGPARGTHIFQDKWAPIPHAF